MGHLEEDFFEGGVRHAVAPDAQAWALSLQAGQEPLVLGPHVWREDKDQLGPSLLNQLGAGHRLGHKLSNVFNVLAEAVVQSCRPKT